jgi:hypothetical protein
MSSMLDSRRSSHGGNAFDGLPGFCFRRLRASVLTLALRRKDAPAASGVRITRSSSSPKPGMGARRRDLRVAYAAGGWRAAVDSVIEHQVRLDRS